jgi:methyl-accepting chemotaxis protein
MIGGFETLNSKISMTTDIVERVSRASNDQMNVIEHINQAIGELNEATQENSLIIEKTDSVAEEVAFLSNKLVEDANSKQFIGKA